MSIENTHIRWAIAFFQLVQQNCNGSSDTSATLPIPLTLIPWFNSIPSCNTWRYRESVMDDTTKMKTIGGEETRWASLFRGVGHARAGVFLQKSSDQEIGLPSGGCPSNIVMYRSAYSHPSLLRHPLPQKIVLKEKVSVSWGIFLKKFRNKNTHLSDLLEKPELSGKKFSFTYYENWK